MTRARELSKLGNENIFSVDSNLNVGVGSLTPDTKLDVIGVVSATSFYGDGSALTGIAGTADVRTSTLVVSGVSTFNGTTNLNSGVVITGVATATSFSGNITGTAATFTGNVTVGGTLTYDDVTNIDSIGLITARDGLQVTGGIVTVTGQTNLANLSVSGISTLTDGIDASDLLKEEVNITAGKLSDNTNIDLENGMVHLFTTTETTTSTPNIRYSSSESLTSKMSVGQSIVVTLITAAASGAYSANITIDGGAVTEYWIGGSAPDAGGTSGVDVHTFTIIKIGTSGTPNGDFRVIANHSKTS